MLQTRVRFKCLPLDFVEEVWASPKEFMVRELPDLGICRRPLCAWSLMENACQQHVYHSFGQRQTDPVDLVKPIHVQLTHKA
jgi:hypothetical protein